MCIFYFSFQFLLYLPCNLIYWFLESQDGTDVENAYLPNIIYLDLAKKLHLWYTFILVVN